jgi:hypothetical protein
MSLVELVSYRSEEGRYPPWGDSFVYANASLAGCVLHWTAI